MALLILKTTMFNNEAGYNRIRNVYFHLYEVQKHETINVLFESINVCDKL